MRQDWPRNLAESDIEAVSLETQLVCLCCLWALFPSVWLRSRPLLLTENTPTPTLVKGWAF